MDILIDILWQCWLVLGEMAPYLLLGFLVAGILAVAIPARWVERHLGRNSLGAVVKAAAVGVPLPLCSCGVIPVAASIRRHGASRGATASFLLSTPQTGVDSIAATYAILGPVMAVFRPLIALLSGVIGGVLVYLFGEKESSFEKEPPGEKNQTVESPSDDTCPAVPAVQPRSITGRAVEAIHYGFVTLPRDIGNTLLLGIAVAGLIAAVVPPGRLEPYLGGGLGAMLLMVLVSIPIYVCATGSVPIAAGFIHLGASPGAAFAFLVAGPATNAATVATIYKVLGRRTAAAYLFTAVAAALAGGWLLDQLYAGLAVSPPHLGGHDASAHHGGASHVWAVVLLLVLVFAYLEPLLRGRRTSPAGTAPVAEPKGAERIDLERIDIERIELTIGGMNCSHCVEAVTRALEELPGVRTVEVTLTPGRAVVTGERLDAKRLAEAVAALGYQADVSKNPA